MNIYGIFQFSTDYDGYSHLPNPLCPIKAGEMDHWQITIDGNNALDAFCAGNGTDGLTLASAHVINDSIIDAKGSGGGFLLKDTDRYLLIKNVTFTNASNWSAVGTGLKLSNCTRVTIENCIFQNNFIRISLYAGSGNNLIKNEKGFNSGDVYITNSIGNIIENNIFSNCVTTIEGSNANLFFNNTLTYCEIGLRVLDSNNNFFSGNLITHCIGEGIVLVESDGNTLECNRIEYNGAAGIRLDNSDYNKISRNTLMGNAGPCIFLQFGGGFGGEEFYRNFINWNFIYDNTNCWILLLPGGSLWIFPLFFIMALIAIRFVTRPYRIRKSNGIFIISLLLLFVLSHLIFFFGSLSAFFVFVGFYCLSLILYQKRKTRER